MNSVKYARAVLKNYKIKPNKSEQRLDNFLDENFKGKFIYNRGQILIEGKIPDYFGIDDKKVLIEFAGRRFHTEEELEEKKKLFAKYGFRTLIIWQEELGDEQKLFEKILFWYYKNLVVQ